jgi:hypothetical protein
MDKQSEENTVFDTGAQRDDRKGKLRFSLVPHKPLERLMKRYLEGAETYGENNWKKGMGYSVYYDSAMRHLTSFWQGKKSEDHLAAAAWNIFALMHHEDTKLDALDLDDREDNPN